MLEIATLGVNKLIHNEATYHMFVLMAVRENDLIAVATLCAYLLFHSLTLSLFLLAPHFKCERVFIGITLSNSIATL